MRALTSVFEGGGGVGGRWEWRQRCFPIWVLLITHSTKSPLSLFASPLLTPPAALMSFQGGLPKYTLAPPLPSIVLPSLNPSHSPGIWEYNYTVVHLEWVTQNRSQFLDLWCLPLIWRSARSRNFGLIVLEWLLLFLNSGYGNEQLKLQENTWFQSLPYTTSYII